MDPLTSGLLRRGPARLRSAVTCCLALAVTLALGPISPAVFPTSATTATILSQALTPPLGFNSWNAYGCSVTEQLIEKTADAMVADGMVAAGYDYVVVDDCWMSGSRSADGSLVADPVKFPDGIAALVTYVHARGLRFGIYADAGTTTCAGFAGSYGHEAQDAATFAQWGVDYVKYDQCNIPWSDFGSLSHAQVDQLLYTRFSNALASTRRRIVLSACTGVDGTSDPQSWAPSISNLWRSTGDISDSFASMLSIVRANAALSSLAGPSHWNDPDMLEIGNGAMTQAEYRAEFSLWAIMAAPLFAGTSLSSATSQTLAILENAAVLAVDQDSIGIQGRLVSDQDGLLTFLKPLANGDVAVVLFNSTTTAVTMSVDVALPASASASASASPSSVLHVTDLWSPSTSTSTASISTGRISAMVAGHSVQMYRVSA